MLFALVIISSNCHSQPADTNYDVFATWTGAAVALELSPWANGTTRSQGIQRLNGVWVRNGNTTLAKNRLSVFFEGDSLSHFTSIIPPTDAVRS